MYSVFPMYVGVILKLTIPDTIAASIPHVRGGDPFTRFIWLEAGSYSPCTWG